MTDFLKYASIFLIILALFIVLLRFTIGEEALAILMYAAMGIILLVAGGWIASALMTRGALIAQGGNHRDIGRIAGQVARDVGKVYQNQIAGQQTVGAIAPPQERPSTLMPETSVIDYSDILSSAQAEIDGLGDDVEYLDHTELE
jgi:hypothetical protein